MFPGAKFLLMIRDGRAVVHSIMSRKVCFLSTVLTAIFVVMYCSRKMCRNCTLGMWQVNFSSSYKFG